MTDYTANNNTNDIKEDYGGGGNNKYSHNNKYGDEENEIAVEAIPDTTGGPPLAPGQQRFYCEKCRAVRTHK
jgi:hypothetical protein